MFTRKVAAAATAILSVFLLTSCNFNFTTTTSPEGKFTGTYSVERSRKAIEFSGGILPAEPGVLETWEADGVSYTLEATEESTVTTLTFTDKTAEEIDEIVTSRMEENPNMQPNPAPSGILGDTISYDGENTTKNIIRTLPAARKTPETGKTVFPFESAVNNGKVMVFMPSDRISAILGPPSSNNNEKPNPMVEEIAAETLVKAKITMPGKIISLEGAAPGAAALNPQIVFAVEKDTTVTMSTKMSELLTLSAPSGTVFAVTSEGGKPGYTYPEENSSASPETTPSPAPSTTSPDNPAENPPGEPVENTSNSESGNSNMWIVVLGFMAFLTATIGGFAGMFTAGYVFSRKPSKDDTK